ncbi:hypothetical protein ACFPIJ_14665 [Dactylosporangium cerinum]|uniref:Uncharacterized protein n=1 Tax=Dactylosporangium cerinum TaxID=1434730 RepID=A0ABV9VSS8_9ACTN
MWPEGLPHHVEAHDVRLPGEAGAVAAWGAAPTGGNPAALDGAAPLRPFLFHRTPGGLEPIWLGEV